MCFPDDSETLVSMLSSKFILIEGGTAVLKRSRVVSRNRSAVWLWDWRAVRLEIEVGNHGVLRVIFHPPVPSAALLRLQEKLLGCCRQCEECPQNLR